MSSAESAAAHNKVRKGRWGVQVPAQVNLGNISSSSSSSSSGGGSSITLRGRRRKLLTAQPTCSRGRLCFSLSPSMRITLADTSCVGQAATTPTFAACGAYVR